MTKPVVDAHYRKQVEKARRQLRALISEHNCARLMLRLAWNDAATYNKVSKTGGRNGSIRLDNGVKYKVDEELKRAVDLCEEAKAKANAKITYADLYQLAGVVAVEVAGGPTIDFVPGREDVMEHEGRIPDLNNKDGGSLRAFFNRMGLDDKDIVALYGGLAWAEAHKVGSDPLKFDHSYFRELLTRGSSQLSKVDDAPRKPTTFRNYVEEYAELSKVDDALLKETNFRNYVEEYAENEDAFFRDYATSHKKLSQLGCNLENHLILRQGIIAIVVIASAAILGYLWKRKTKEGKR